MTTGRSVSRLLCLCLVLLFPSPVASFLISKNHPITTSSRPLSLSQLYSIPKEESEEEGKNTALLKDRSKRWILLVDDEESIRKGVGQLLLESGFGRVTTCEDGQSAWDQLIEYRQEQQLPDIIVSDIRMPGGMDGLDLLQRLRQDDEFVKLPVVLLTAKGQTRDRIAGYNAGADAYLPKPFDPDELVSLLDSLLARHQQLQTNVPVHELKQDLQDIQNMLLQQGGGGVGNGWVQATNVFLAPDEREVLELLCQGFRNKEIAEQTFRSTRRVEQLLTSMFRKANVKNRTELVRWAVSTGNVRL